MMTFTIRQTRIGDVTCLPDIERSAGHLFRTVPDLAWIADGDDMSAARHLELVAAGTSWVAETDGGECAAFLCAELAVDALHICELAVSVAFQRHGIGRALIQRAINFADEHQLTSLTLTTFLSVPWNEPIYRRMGFETVSTNQLDPRLRDILEREIRGGFPRELRCAMRMQLA